METQFSSSAAFPRLLLALLEFFPTYAKRVRQASLAERVYLARQVGEWLSGVCRRFRRNRRARRSCPRDALRLAQTLPVRERSGVVKRRECSVIEAHAA